MEKYKFIVGGALGLLTFFIGGIDNLFLTLCSMVLIDLATGFLKAIHNGNLSSEPFYKGGIKKVGIFLIVACANIIDNSMNLGGVLRAAAIGYYIANEGLSLMENWGNMGLPLPPKLKEVLKQLHSDEESDKLTKKE